MTAITFLLGVALGIFAMCLRRSLPDGRQGQAIQYCQQVLKSWNHGPWEVARTVLDILEGKQ
jgi:hypothetical protein